MCFALALNDVRRLRMSVQGAKEVERAVSSHSTSSPSSTSISAHPHERTPDYLPANAHRDLRRGGVRQAREQQEQEDRDKESQRASVEDVKKLKAKRPDLAHIVTEDLRQYPDAVAAQLDNLKIRDDSSTITAGVSASDAIFAQLHAIQSLQVCRYYSLSKCKPDSMPFIYFKDEITREHKRLENLSDDNITPTSGKGHNAGNEPAGNSSTSEPLSNSANRAGPQGGADGGFKREGGGAGNGNSRSTATDRSAAQAYDKLAAGFHERAKRVDAIMQKMGELSQAVKKFHSLPPPVLFPEQTILQSEPVVETPKMLSPVNRIA